MPPVLYAHPFSSYCWKVFIALYENAIEFEYRRVDDPRHAGAWADAWPLKRMPLLRDGQTVVPEATIIIEHLQYHHPGPKPMIPATEPAALHVRMLDRLSDNYLMTPMQTIVADRLRPPTDRDPHGVAQARQILDSAYAWWDAHLNGREWAADAFGLAECATAPALFYADWVHPIPERHSWLRAYRARLLKRPSVARAVDDARPFRALFPFGDPGRD